VHHSRLVSDHFATKSLLRELTRNLNDHDDAIQLHRKSKKFDVFQTKMKEMGAPFPDSFVQNLDRIILSMHPKYKKKAKKAAEMTVGGEGALNGKGKDKDIDRVVDEETDRRARLFPGLAVPDSNLKSHEQFLKDERNAGPVLPDVDDLMKELEGVGSKRRTGGGQEDFRGDNGYKRQRVEDDGYDGRGRGRSPPPGGRPDGRDNGYGTRLGAGAGGKNGYDGRGRQDDKPVLYKIYNGKVSNIKDFGCFVTLEGISGRQEGMVHISSMASSRVNSPADLVARNQPVKVKVMSIAGSKVSLSMKDVDQSTGADLSPHLYVKTDQEIEEEERRRAARPPPVTGANSATIHVDERKGSAKRCECQLVV
jgi:ATP-dependent RNA helicase DHX8/PRP22